MKRQLYAAAAYTVFAALCVLAAGLTIGMVCDFASWLIGA